MSIGVLAWVIVRQPHWLDFMGVARRSFLDEGLGLHLSVGIGKYIENVVRDYIV